MDRRYENLTPLGEDCDAAQPPDCKVELLIRLAQLLEDFTMLFSLLLPSTVTLHDAAGGNGDNPPPGKRFFSLEELHHEPAGRLQGETGLKIKMLLRSK